MERHGIPTITIALVRDVAERVRPPRALAVPFPFGHPLGGPHDFARQRSVLETALALLDRPGPGPVLEDYQPDELVT